MSGWCPGKDHKLQGSRDLNLESWFSHSLALWPGAGYLTSLSLNFLIYKIRVMIVASCLSSISFPEGSYWSSSVPHRFQRLCGGYPHPHLQPSPLPCPWEWHFCSFYRQLHWDVLRQLKYIIRLPHSMFPGSLLFKEKARVFPPATSSTWSLYLPSSSGMSCLFFMIFLGLFFWGDFPGFPV